MVVSTNKKYPASSGWFTFRYLSVVYYLRITSKGVKIIQFKGGKAVTGKMFAITTRSKIS